MTDLLIRQVSESRAGAERPDDYDVIGADGLVIGRVFDIGHTCRNRKLGMLLARQIRETLRVPRARSCQSGQAL